MFTGIVEELGRVNSLRGSRLRIDAEVVLHDVVMGASIAVNGCCLTVVATGSDDGSGSWWEADVSDETFRRTSLGTLAAGDPVNLERPVRLADRLGGHLVQGHVDAVARIKSRQADGRSQRFTFELPGTIARYVAAKGSIAVEGVSLTVNQVDGDGFGVNLVPHTLSHTTLGSARPGQAVNLEVDPVARYLERLLGESGYLAAAGRHHPGTTLNKEDLSAWGDHKR